MTLVVLLLLLYGFSFSFFPFSFLQQLFTLELLFQLCARCWCQGFERWSIKERKRSSQNCLEIVFHDARKPTQVCVWTNSLCVKKMPRIFSFITVHYHQTRCTKILRARDDRQTIFSAAIITIINSHTHQAVFISTSSIQWWSLIGFSRDIKTKINFRSSRQPHIREQMIQNEEIKKGKKKFKFWFVKL